MDLLFDESLVKSIKPLGLAVLGIASVISKFSITQLLRMGSGDTWEMMINNRR